MEGIKRMITGGVLSAGARLPVEKDLAAELGVSRGSLREGVRALCIMGVLETRQGDGTYVTSLEPSLLLAPMSFLVDLNASSNSPHLQSVRRVLETEAAGRAALLMTDADLAAAEKILLSAEALIYSTTAIDHDAVMEADIAFHRVVARGSGNPALEALVEALASRTVRARMWRAVNEEGAERATHQEHRAILLALARHDPDSARIRMGSHLLAVEDFMHDQARLSDPPQAAAGQGVAAEATEPGRTFASAADVMTGQE
ncbi:FadR/GntR family transcriptional regulator [Arthrobacter sp. 92]|uniref:FadR/GntR family transcriptional regulator n=1 Tax=Arthrobacter sp. 92 TaxID=3418175 RepID=UPI003CFE4AEE